MSTTTPLLDVQHLLVRARDHLLLALGDDEVEKDETNVALAAQDAQLDRRAPGRQALGVGAPGLRFFLDLRC